MADIASNDYEYDIFLSYKRDPLFDGWVERFVDHLQAWLTLELARKASLFYDKSAIQPGKRFPAAIDDGLRTAKCLLGLWSPYYFQSDWCKAEWITFFRREEHLKLRGGGLIVGLSIHDGDAFPREANEIQLLDISDYVSTISRFWDTERAVEFEQRFKKKLVSALASAVKRAPAFSSDWPIAHPEDVAGTMSVAMRPRIARVLLSA